MGTLISAEQLQARLADPGLVIVDCRFDLGDPAAGARTYAAAHLPGAVHADLDRELSDLRKRGAGRHPLPDAADFVGVMRRLGISRDSFVVAYDSGSGAIAARLWWLLRATGHEAAAVLDGGFEGWQRERRSTTDETVAPAPGDFGGEYDASMMVDFDQVTAGLSDGSLLLLDARAAERFSGRVEPLDKVAGHIPGALNRPFTDNLRGGYFRPRDELVAAFTAQLGDHRPRDVAHMCGSGVTACHNLLAMEHAGLAGSRLYAPSWSGWISDPSRPTALGS